MAYETNGTRQAAYRWLSRNKQLQSLRDQVQRLNDQADKLFDDQEADGRLIAAAMKALGTTCLKSLDDVIVLEHGVLKVLEYRAVYELPEVDGEAPRPADDAAVADAMASLDEAIADSEASRDDEPASYTVPDETVHNDPYIQAWSKVQPVTPRGVANNIKPLLEAMGIRDDATASGGAA